MEGDLLLSQQVLRFDGAKHEVQGCYGIRNNENAQIKFVLPIRLAALQSVNEMLLELVRDHQTSDNIEVYVRLCELLPNGSNNGEGQIELRTKGGNHILDFLCDIIPERLKLNLSVSDFGVMSNQDTTKTDRSMVRYSLKIGGNQLCRYRNFVSPSNPGQPSSVWFYTSLFSFSDFPAALIDCWKNGKSFTGSFSISVFAEDCLQNLILQQRALGNTRIANYKKMLHESIEADMFLISKDKKIVNCHRAVLAASSNVLQRKLEMQTGNERVDVMQHLSFECINVVLTYMYYGDVSEVNTSLEFALQVLEAAMEFHLNGLIFHVQKYLESKPNQVFTANDAVKLYLIVKSSLDKNEPLQIGVGNDEEHVHSNVASQQEQEGNKSDHENMIDEEDESNKENTEVNNEDKNEAEIRRGTGNGPVTGAKKRKNLDNGQTSDKRNCVEKASEDRLQEIKAILSGISITNNVKSSGRTETDEIALINLVYSLNDNNKDDYVRYRNLLETQADRVILWFYKNNRDSLEKAVVDQQRVKWAIELLEIWKLSIQALQQQQLQKQQEMQKQNELHQQELEKQKQLHQQELQKQQQLQKQQELRNRQELLKQHELQKQQELQKQKEILQLELKKQNELHQQELQQQKDLQKQEELLKQQEAQQKVQEFIQRQQLLQQRPPPSQQQPYSQGPQQQQHFPQQHFQHQQQQ